MKRKMAGMLAGFLALMLAFTLLSRAADSVTIARVSVQRAQQGRIVHKVSASGTVTPNREQAVSTLAGQTVKTIFAEEGQQVSAGEVLFCIDTGNLQEQILEKKRELQIADLQAKDRKSGIEAQSQKDAINKNRAAEDYSAAAGRGNTAVSRAWQELQAARKKLKLLESGAGSAGAGDSVLGVLQEACREKQLEYEQALAHREELEKLIDEEVERALGQSGESASARADENARTETALLVTRERAAHLLAIETETVSAEAQTETTELQLPETLAEPEQTQLPQESETANTATEPEAENSEAMPEMSSEALAGSLRTESPETEIQGSEPLPAGAETPAPEPAQTDQELILGDETEAPAEDPYLVEQRIRLENQPLLEEADRLILAKKQEKKAADAALSEYLAASDSGAQASAQEMRGQIEAEIRVKEQAYEDALTAANDSLRAAGRAVEDAGAPKGSDSTVEIDELTREQQELQLEKLEALLEENGEVRSPIDGLVTKLNISTGERTPDGTAVLLSDRASGNKIVVQVTEEQSRYISRGDAAEVYAEGKEKLQGLAVESMRASAEDPAMLDVTVQLPADTLEAGMYATVETERRSDIYDCCLPVQALNEESGKYFVYILAESSSVLGTELTAQRRDVTVLDKNESLAALEGSLGDSRVIVASDKLISQGSRVRLEE